MSETGIRSISHVWHNNLAKSSSLTLRITAFCYVASGFWQHFSFTHRFLDNAETFTTISKLIVSRPSILNQMVSTFYCFMCLKLILELYLTFSWILLVFPDSSKSLLKSLRIWWKYWSRFPFARMYCTVREASQNTWNNKKRKQWDRHYLDSEQSAQIFRWFHQMSQLKSKSSAFQLFLLGFTPEQFWEWFWPFPSFL